MEDLKKKNVIQKMLGSNKYDIVNIVNCLQCFSLGLRLEHWSTKNYSYHKATEKIQESLDGKIDDFVEACVGFDDGHRPEFKKELLACIDTESVINSLKNLNINDTSLLNIRDEILQLIYKFKYLKTLN